MKIWITSLSGAIALSFVHLLFELWRGFLDFSFVLPEYSDGRVDSTALYALIYTVVFATWLFGIWNARQEKRGGLITAIVVGALFWVGVDLGTIFFYCPGGCPEVLFDVTTYASLIVGALALFSLIVNLRQKSSQPSAQRAQDISTTAN